MKITKYRRPSLRALVGKLNSEDAIRDFTAKIQEGMEERHIRMSDDSLRKINALLMARRKALKAVILYGPDGNPIVK
jgi:hypothetical protein